MINDKKKRKKIKERDMIEKKKETWKYCRESKRYN